MHVQVLKLSSNKWVSKLYLSLVNRSTAIIKQISSSFQFLRFGIVKRGRLNLLKSLEQKYFSSLNAIFYLSKICHADIFKKHYLEIKKQAFNEHVFRGKQA